MRREAEKVLVVEAGQVAGTVNVGGWHKGRRRRRHDALLAKEVVDVELILRRPVARIVEHEDCLVGLVVGAERRVCEACAPRKVVRGSVDKDVADRVVPSELRKERVDRKPALLLEPNVDVAVLAAAGMIGRGHRVGRHHVVLKGVVAVADAPLVAVAAARARVGPHVGLGGVGGQPRLGQAALAGV